MTSERGARGVKRFIEWSILLLVALVAMGLIVRGILDRSTGKQRDVAVARVRARLNEVLDETPRPVPRASPAPAEAAAPPAPPPLSAESELNLRERWGRLLPRVDGIFSHHHDANNRCAGDVVCELSGGGSLRDLPEADRALLVAFVADNGELADEIVALVSEGQGLLDWVCCGDQVLGPGPFASRSDAAVFFLSVAAFTDALAGKVTRGAERAAAALRLWQHLPVTVRGYALTLLDMAATEVRVAASSRAMDEELAEILSALSAEPCERDVFARELAKQAKNDLEWVEGMPRSGRTLPPRMFLYREAWLVYSTACRPLLNRDVTCMAETVERLVEAARLPYYEAKPFLDEAADKAGGHPFTAHFSTASVMSIVRAFHWQANTEARRDTRRVGAALDAFRVRYGRYPESLDELAADADAKLPADPITGEAFMYRLDEEGCVLYSIGLNEQDDGGESGNYFEGDIVWRGRGG